MEPAFEADYRALIMLWFDFLALNEEYRRACEARRTEEFAKVYRVFGDIRNVDFDDWWPARKECFERLSWELEALGSGDDANPRADNSDELVVVVNLYAPTDDIERAFKDALAKAKEAWQPKDSEAAKNNGHVYADLKIYGVGMDSKLAGKVKTLERVLKVYMGSIHPDTRDEHRYKLAKALELSASQTNIDAETPKGKKNRRSLSSRASQDISRAETIIYFAARGIFPAPEHLRRPEDSKKGEGTRFRARKAIAK
jgi:hypothetical protein